MILISIGMLVLLSTALGREAIQSAASSVQSMLSPVVPQADDPGTSPELNAADPAVSLQAQAHPEPPPLQVHSGDVTAVTELVDNSREHSAVEVRWSHPQLAEPTPSDRVR